MLNIKLLWEQAFNESIGAEQEKHGTNPVDWKAGGRASKAWPSKENGDWWAEKGPEMVANFIEFWKQSGWQVWETPEGIKAIELQLNVDYGDIRIKAFVDLVAVTPDGELVVVDFKTGANIPTSAMQLALYACSIDKQFGIRPTQGYYYDARNVMMLPAQGFNNWTYPLFTELFRQFEFAVQNQIFLPNLDKMCSYCSVKDFCYAYGGDFKDAVDPLALIAHPKETNV
jgi:putative RecB family exonuclease